MNNDELKLQIGANIARLRKDAGMTQAELAERLNYSDKAISKWERGESMPDVLTLVQLSELLNITVNDLVGSSTPAPAAPVPEEVPSKKKQKKKGCGNKPKRVADKNVIQKLSSILVWTIALFIYLVLDSFGVRNCWMIFVLAVIANAIVLLSLRAAWKMYGINRILISIIMWGSLIFFYLCIWLIWNVSVWRVFLLGLLGQAAITLWFRMFKAQEDENE